MVTEAHNTAISETPHSSRIEQAVVEERNSDTDFDGILNNIKSRLFKWLITAGTLVSLTACGGLSVISGNPTGRQKKYIADEIEKETKSRFEELEQKDSETKDKIDGYDVTLPTYAAKINEHTGIIETHSNTLKEHDKTLGIHGTMLKNQAGGISDLTTRTSKVEEEIKKVKGEFKTAKDALIKDIQATIAQDSPLTTELEKLKKALNELDKKIQTLGPLDPTKMAAFEDKVNEIKEIMKDQNIDITSLIDRITDWEASMGTI